MWIGLVTVCAIGVVNITDPRARELTASAAWGADEIISTALGLLGAGVAGWISDHRFAIAIAIVLVAAADLVALAAFRSLRDAERRRPQVRLRDWMELPRPVPERVPSPAYAAIGRFNGRVTAVLAFGVALVVKAALDLAIWGRAVLLPRETRRMARLAAAGRVQSRAGLEALRETAAQLQFAARAWYVAAGEPAFQSIATRAAGALHTAAVAGKGIATPESAQVVDIQVLLSAQSIGWYGPLMAPNISSEGEGDVAEPRSDRLAS